MVLDAAVVEHIGANLRTPLYPLLLRLDSLLCGKAFVEFVLIEFRTENAHGVLLVHQLGTGLLILDDVVYLLARILVLEFVAQTGRRFDLIDILTAGSARTERLPHDIRRIDDHFDGIVHRRSNGDGCECSLTLVVGIERGQTHHAVHTVLAFQITVGIFALELHRARLDTDLVARLVVEHLHLVAVRLAPTHIHAHEHRRPVEGLRTAGARIYIDDSTHAVLLAPQHVAQFECLDKRYALGIQCVAILLGSDTFLDEFGHHFEFLGAFADVVEIDNPTLYRCDFAQLGLRLVGRLPEIGFERLLLLVL